MSDDSLSASQLRSRYQKGGSAGDSDLSASQIRARYGVETNSFKAGGNTFMVYAIVAVVIIGSVLIKIFLGK